MIIYTSSSVPLVLLMVIKHIQCLHCTVGVRKDRCHEKLAFSIQTPPLFQTLYMQKSRQLCQRKRKKNWPHKSERRQVFTNALFLTAQNARRNSLRAAPFVAKRWMQPYA